MWLADGSRRLADRTIFGLDTGRIPDQNTKLDVMPKLIMNFVINVLMCFTLIAPICTDCTTPRHAIYSRPLFLHFTYDGDHVHSQCEVCPDDIFNKHLGHYRAGQDTQDRSRAQHSRPEQ